MDLNGPLTRPGMILGILAPQADGSNQGQASEDGSKKALTWHDLLIGNPVDPRA